MEFLAKYWYLIIIAVIFLVFVITGIVIFLKMPKKQQIKVIKKWLLWAVTEAERELGSGTGQLKLRYVYNLFIERFWYLSDVITFEMVSTLVDEALDEMRSMLSSNRAVAEYVEGNSELKEIKA